MTHTMIKKGNIYVATIVNGTVVERRYGSKEELQQYISKKEKENGNSENNNKRNN